MARSKSTLMTMEEESRLRWKRVARQSTSRSASAGRTAQELLSKSLVSSREGRRRDHDLAQHSGELDAGVRAPGGCHGAAGRAPGGSGEGAGLLQQAAAAADGEEDPSWSTGQVGVGGDGCRRRGSGVGAVALARMQEQAAVGILGESDGEADQGATGAGPVFPEGVVAPVGQGAGSTTALGPDAPRAEQALVHGAGDAVGIRGQPSGLGQDVEAGADGRAA